MPRTKPNFENIPFSGPGVVAMVASFVTGAVWTAMIERPWPAIAGLLSGLYLLFAIRVVRQWERVAILRLGNYRGLRGPGWFMMLPVIETVTSYVDQRVRVSSVSAESTLTRDTVPVNVDAAIFWLVWNAEKALLDVFTFHLRGRRALFDLQGDIDLGALDRKRLRGYLQRYRNPRLVAFVRKSLRLP